MSLLMKTSYKDSLKYVKVLKNEDLTANFFAAAKLTFSINEEKLSVRDKDGVDITEILPDYIENFHGPLTTYFLHEESDVNSARTVTAMELPPTPESLSSISNTSNSVSSVPPITKPLKTLQTFLEEKLFILGKSDSETRRRYYIQLCTDYMIELYGLYPESKDKTVVATEAVTLYPQLRAAGTPLGIETLWDEKSRTGFLEFRLKTIRTRINKERKRVEAEEGKSNDEASTSATLTEAEFLEKIKYLKLAPLTEKEKIIEVSTETAIARQHYLKAHPNTPIYETLPRFFDVEELVDIDFKLNYPNAERLFCWWEKNSGAFTRILPIYDKKTQENVRTYSKDYDEDVKKILIIAFILKPAPSKKTSLSAENYVETFLRFKKDSVPLDEFLKTESVTSETKPFIIAEGRSKTDLNRFIVILDNRELPPQHTFVCALDLCFKTHYVFNVRYHDALHNFWRFFDQFVYKLNKGESPCGAKLRTFFTRLSEEIRDDPAEEKNTS